MHRKMWNDRLIFKTLFKIISEARPELWLGHGTGSECILILLFMSYERLAPFSSCMPPKIENKSDKLSPNASRCNSTCASELLIISPTAMLATMKLWELTAKYHFTQIILFYGSLRITLVMLVEALKRFQSLGYLHNFRTLDLARITRSFMIHISLYWNCPLNTAFENILWPYSIKLFFAGCLCWTPFKPIKQILLQQLFVQQLQPIWWKSWFFTAFLIFVPVKECA